MSDSPKPTYGLLFVRLALGGTITMHGLSHVVGILGGPGLASFAANLAQNHPKLPGWSGHALAITELASGALLVLGLFPRVAALAALLVLGAFAWLGNHHRTFFDEQGGIESYVLQGAMAACILTCGPGRMALGGRKAEE
ncbi:MAG: hypothetical protein RIT25_1507 [Planctomycetota bacterium]|jgi:putative oxidoreductase